MRASLCVAIFVALTASCAPAEDIEVRETCDAYCDCTSVTRLDRSTCIQSCTVRLGADPDSCAGCVDAESCLALEACLEPCLREYERTDSTFEE